MLQIRNIFGLAIVLLAVGLCASLPVGAQAANANAAQGLQISPTRVELNAAKGNTYTIKMSVMNVTASDLVYTPSVNDFSAKDETGAPNIIRDSQLPETASIVSWLAPISKFRLQSRESRTIIAQITIPTNAEPGGHYGVLSFSGSAPELDGTGVGLSASTGLVILIRVDGEITEKASLASFFSASGGEQSSLFENGPFSFVTRIKNEGNIHVKPSGSIEVRDMFGGLASTMQINEGDVKASVLPNSIRRFESQFDRSWMAGMYTANLTLGYGIKGQAITNTISFWVIPYKIILVALLFLGTLIFILSKMIRVYNRRIIEKSKNETIKSKKHTSKKK